MIATLITKTTSPAPPGERQDEGAVRSPSRHHPEDRLHVSALVLGLIDARACHINFLDTSGGQELARWYGLHQPHYRRRSQ